MHKNVLERTQHQGERRAELVTRIGKKRGLGAIDFGQRFGPAFLSLQSAHVSQSRGNLPGQQIDEAAICVVQLTVRVETDDHYARGLSLRLLGDRNDDRLSRRDIPISRGQITEAGREIGHDHGGRFRQRLANRPLATIQRQQRRRRAMVRANPGAASERGLLAPALQQVDEREWQIARIGGEAFGHRGEQIGLTLTVWDPCTDFAQYSQPSLADKTIGVLDNDAKMSSDAAFVIRQGTVRKSMEGFFGISRAAEESAEGPGHMWRGR